MGAPFLKRSMTTVIGALLAIVPIVAIASVMGSTNYQIQSDSINFGGGLSTSTSYSLEDTIGEIATGYSTSTSYMMSAGYQASVNSSISISAPADVTLSAIGGVSGGESSGSAVWTVITSNPTGYSLSISASTDPALQSGSNTIANYTAATADPDFAFSVDATAAEFGFTPEGTDIISRFKDNGSACATGSSDTADRCYDDFETTPKQVAVSTTSNYPSGTATTIKPRVKIGSSVNQAPGTYTATITATAIAF